MFQPRHVPRLHGISINRLIPNIITICALCAGMTAIRFGSMERWEAGVLAVIAAAVLDGLDGRVARLLRATSKFGAELDSLSDFISFGVAPAMLLYFWTMHTLGGFGWALVMLFAVGMALRLARFNTMMGETDLPWAYHFFTGVPAPAGAMLALLPMMLSFQFGEDLFAQPILAAAVLIIVSFLTVSRIPTFSGKKIRIPPIYVLPLMLIVGLTVAVMITAPWTILSLCLLLYLISIPFSIRAFRKLNRQVHAIREHDHVPPENP